jgi:hypothetical protein
MDVTGRLGGPRAPPFQLSGNSDLNSRFPEAPVLRRSRPAKVGGWRATLSSRIHSFFWSARIQEVALLQALIAPAKNVYDVGSAAWVLFGGNCVIVAIMKLASAQSVNDQPLSRYLVWTRMQAEAGQGLDTILKRKELERDAGGGHFFWGVGNSPSVMINSLARTCTPVSVIFSKMKSRPKAVDMNPESTVIWRQYIDCDGVLRPLPPHALITSRGESSLRRKCVHYALECFSAQALRLQNSGERFDSSSYRNASGRGAPVGASQVTALLVASHASDGSGDRDYSIDFRAMLAGSYWVKLVDPLPLSEDALNLLNCAEEYLGDWKYFVSELRGQPEGQFSDQGMPLLL